MRYINPRFTYLLTYLWCCKLQDLLKWFWGADIYGQQLSSTCHWMIADACLYIAAFMLLVMYVTEWLDLMLHFTLGAWTICTSVMCLCSLRTLCHIKVNLLIIVVIVIVIIICWMHICGYSTVGHRCVYKLLTVQWTSVHLFPLAGTTLFATLQWTQYASWCPKQLQYYTVSQEKLCQLIFCSVSVKYEPISIKIVRIVPEETLNKTVPKMPTSPIVCACICIPWEIWSVRLSC